MAGVVRTVLFSMRRDLRCSSSPQRKRVSFEGFVLLATSGTYCCDVGIIARMDPHLTRLEAFIICERDHYPGNNNNLFAFALAQAARYERFVRIISAEVKIYAGTNRWNLAEIYRKGFSMSLQFQCSSGRVSQA